METREFRLTTLEALHGNSRISTSSFTAHTLGSLTYFVVSGFFFNKRNGPATPQDKLMIVGGWV